jgi:[NiFe] hydrogenase diaphorase moiety large subunit
MNEPSSHISFLDPILERYRRRPTYLLQILREAQVPWGYLAPVMITYVASALGLPRSRVEGVASFYSFLHTSPAGRYRVLFSDNITDRMQGNIELMDYLCHKLWIERGKVSEDGLVSVGTTSCTGMCDQGPAILVNERAITRMTRSRVEEIAELILSKVPLTEWPEACFAVEDNIHRSDILLGNQLARGDAIRAAVARGPEDTIERASNERSWRESYLAVARGPTETLDEIKRSNLRGRGGAGFTTASKWEACRNALGEARYVICNADEGEPGTFKDRVLLTRHADLVFEGMTVAAFVLGAEKGMLYLRGEYTYMLERLEQILMQRREANLLGRDIAGQPGFNFDIEIHVGAGAYICGEESALIESLEGKRGVPRNRPPYPVTSGYLQQPTIVNNVETFAAVSLISAKGGDWYRSVGTNKSAGTKILSVSGDCLHPGIYEYPFGVTVEQVLRDCGAQDTQAVQISGPSGICIDDTEFGRRIAFEDLPTAGAFTIFNRSRDMFEVARNYAHFFAHESCGFCTPCRVGTTLLRDTMDKIHEGHGTQYDINDIFNLNRVLQTASHCGLGHTACNPLFDTLQKFRPTYERRLQSLDFQPAFDLDGALAAARQMTGRDDAGAHLTREA